MAEYSISFRQVKTDIEEKSVAQKNNLSALSIGIASIGLCMPQFQSTSHTGVDFSCSRPKKKINW